MGTPQDYASLEQKIASLPQDVLFSFTDADIDWAAADPSPAPRIKMHVTSQASSLYGAAQESAPGNHPFRVSCGGQSLFVGVTYFVGGAAFFSTPVLHISHDADGSVVLRLGAWQGAWMFPGMTGREDPGARARIDRPELRAVFCQRGALRELDPGDPPQGH
jgi:hypothetical protein